MSQRPTSNVDADVGPEPADNRLGIRAALHRKALADARQRTTLARRMGLTQTELLAIEHLARAGPLTPGRLRPLLQLSSAGTTGVIDRLRRGGHITRHTHAQDARSAVVRLTPETATWATKAWAPYVNEIDTVIGALSDDDRDLIEHFLDDAADAAERHADHVAHQADASAVPLPALCS